MEEICLGCIANGTAANRLAPADGPAEFTPVDWGVPDEVPVGVLEEISRRTPGFYAWQESRWIYLFECLHCGVHLAYSDAS